MCNGMEGLCFCRLRSAAFKCCPSFWGLSLGRCRASPTRINPWPPGAPSLHRLTDAALGRNLIRAQLVLPERGQLSFALVGKEVQVPAPRIPPLLEPTVLTGYRRIPPVIVIDPNAPPKPSLSTVMIGFVRKQLAVMRGRRELRGMADRQLADVGILRADINILTAMGRFGG